MSETIAFPRSRSIAEILDRRLDEAQRLNLSVKALKLRRDEFHALLYEGTRRTRIALHRGEWRKVPLVIASAAENGAGA